MCNFLVKTFEGEKFLFDLVNKVDHRIGGDEQLQFGGVRGVVMRLFGEEAYAADFLELEDLVVFMEGRRSIKFVDTRSHHAT
jgi:hypothetical protein